MDAAYPAAWPTLSFLELRDQPFDVLFPCLILFNRDSPADPLVACERRKIFPRRQRFLVRDESLS